MQIDQQTLTDGATITWNVTSGSNASVTLGGNRTLAVDGWVTGDTGVLIVKQDSTGGRNLDVTLGGSSVFIGSGVPYTASAAAGSKDLLGVYYDGTNYYWSLGYGDSSDTGAQGATGAQGTTGTTGPKGLVGAQGTQGDKGFVGAQGDKGFVGAQGTGGAAAPQGADGEKGAQGAQGVFGLPGTKGEPGAQGTIGIGTQGVAGEKGAQGSTGLGTKGAQGAQGTIGAGTQGTDGAQGAFGLPGSKGEPGAQGTIGIGTQGTDGAQGTQGSTGLGIKGAQGATGPTGGASISGDGSTRIGVLGGNGGITGSADFVFANSLNLFKANSNAIFTGSLTVGQTASISTTVGRGDFTNDVVAYSTSDINFKDNITPIEGSLDKIQQINGVEFDWKPLTEEEKIYLHGNEGHDVGVIAQEIEKVLPEVVTTRESGFKAVRYEKIIPLLIEAIKEQQKQIDSLKNE